MQLYAACLASYNAGRLYGKWIEASSDPDDMREAIADMLAASPTPGAEEWAIHDYDGFPNMGEYPDLKAVAELADLIETAEHDHGIKADDFRAIADNWHGNADDIGEALDRFCGIFDSFRDYADEAADEMLACYTLPDTVRNYFDYEAWARDLALEMTVIDCPSGVAVFHD